MIELELDCETIAKELLVYVNCRYEEWEDRNNSGFATYGEWLKSPIGWWNNSHPLKWLETKVTEMVEDESSTDYDRAFVDDQYDNEWREWKSDQYDEIMEIIFNTPIG